MAVNRLPGLIGRKLQRSFGSRASERGAVIFVVLLVLSVLTAIGIFAARAAGLNQRVSGYSRQSTQTGYVAEYGATALAAELSGGRKQIYFEQLKNGTDTCSSLRGMPDGGADNPCFQMNAAEFAQRLTEDGLTEQYFDPSGESFGISEQPVVGAFRVETTDPGPAAGKVSGTEMSDRSAGFKNMQVTLTAIGQVRPTSATDADAGVCNSETERESAQVAGSRSMRVYVTVPAVSQ